MDDKSLSLNQPAEDWQSEKTTDKQENVDKIFIFD